MTKFNISQAAKLYRKDRNSIQRKLKNGGLSFKTNEKGHKEIDLAELIRVFGEPPTDATVDTHAANDSIQQLDTPPATPVFEQKIKELEELLEAECKEREREKEEYQKREVWLQQKIDQMTLTLPNYTDQKRGFWSRLLG